MSEHQGIFTSAAVQDYLSAPANLTSEQLSDRLWTTTDGKYRTVFVEADNSVIAFDTFGTPARARAYAAEIARVIPGKPISTIIYSHDHLDHAGFAADLAADANIVADEMTAKVVAMRGADGQLPVTEALSSTAVPFTGRVIYPHGLKRRRYFSLAIQFSAMPVTGSCLITTSPISSRSCAVSWIWILNALYRVVTN
jgi:glyoxylase-like metal-dependent hydrolase (beta-lactamase superfamily II)